ncbi:MAG: MotA/TolQ/ExbB proton channel family protein, partial [Sphingomonas sp.]
MLTTILAAGTAAADGSNPYGLIPMLQQGGVISIAVFSILVLMLVVSLYIMFTKLFEQQKVRNE